MVPKSRSLGCKQKRWFINKCRTSATWINRLKYESVILPGMAQGQFNYAEKNEIGRMRQKWDSGTYLKFASASLPKIDKYSPPAAWEQGHQTKKDRVAVGFSAIAKRLACIRPPAFIQLRVSSVRKVSDFLLDERTHQNIHASHLFSGVILPAEKEQMRVIKHTECVSLKWNAGQTHDAWVSN